jgi:quercetin dioxygenase-like cupin family protein
MTELVGSPAAVRTRVIPARSGERLTAEASGLSAWLMHAEPREHRSELFELGLPAGVEHAGTPHAPGTEEVVVCVAGRLAAGPASDPPVLGPGDAVHFAADVPHVYRALEDTSALNLMLYPWRAP